MYPLLLAISFILHLFAFFWILLLSMRLKQANEIEKRQGEIQKEIEDLFQSYLLEMKEENEKLLNTIEKSTNNNEGKSPEGKVIKPSTVQKVESYQSATKLRGKMTQKMYQNQSKNQQNQNPQKPMVTPTQENTSDYVPPLPTGEDQFEQSLASQVVLLHEKGYKPDEIAQKLNKGKTEIELLLKFRGQYNN